jgi:hypothetical protein
MKTLVKKAKGTCLPQAYQKWCQNCGNSDGNRDIDLPGGQGADEANMVSRILGMSHMVGPMGSYSQDGTKQKDRQKPPKGHIPSPAEAGLTIQLHPVIAACLMPKS